MADKANAIFIGSRAGGDKPQQLELTRARRRVDDPVRHAVGVHADRLVVAVNDDVAAGKKGPGRPIFTAEVRAELVAALRGVDYVTIFPEATVAPPLTSSQPTGSVASVTRVASLGPWAR